MIWIATPFAILVLGGFLLWAMRRLEQRGYRRHRYTIAGTVPAPALERFGDPWLLHTAMYDWETKNLSTPQQMFVGPMPHMLGIALDPRRDASVRLVAMAHYRNWADAIGREAEARALIGERAGSAESREQALAAFDCPVDLDTIERSESASAP